MILIDGLNIVIAGPPNVGKSSLMNRLAGYDAAIVTDIPGTTRDALREQLSLDGLPVTIIDTAGLRDSADPVELEGIRRAHRALEGADRLIWVTDIRSDLAMQLAEIRRVAGEDKAMTAEALVDRCLDQMGPLEVAESSRKELIAQVESGGPVSFDTEEGYTDFSHRAGSTMALIAATREYQFG